MQLRVSQLLFTMKWPIKKGYLNNEETTKSTINSDGWLLTGDIGYIDSHGELYLADRKKIIIKYKSHSLLPSSLENFVKNQFDVLNVVVIGIPVEDDIGEMPAAVVVLPPESIVTASDIAKAVEGNCKSTCIYLLKRNTRLLFWSLDNFSPLKHLCGGVYIVDSLPLNSNGKVQRNEVQQIAIKLFGLKNLQKSNC